jgi:hypothetical protein
MEDTILASHRGAATGRRITNLSWLPARAKKMFSPETILMYAAPLRNQELQLSLLRIGEDALR